jgi:superfamily I DNA/RNA helicase
MPIKQSKYQKAIYKNIDRSKKNLLIQATAGSGKSYTIFQSIQQLCTKPKPINILYLSFGKEISKYAASKIDTTKVNVHTFHGYGSRILSHAGYKYKLDSKKVFSFVKKTKILKDIPSKYRYSIATLLEKIRDTGILTYDVDILQKIFKDNWKTMLKFGSTEIDYAVLKSRMDLISKCLQVLDKNKKEMDFNDLQRFPLLLNLFAKIPLRDIPDIVFVDEAQDLNDYQMSFIKELQKRGSRFVVVGDEHQAIYGFRGADMSSMDTLDSLLKPIKLSLSVSYRCSSKIVNYIKYRRKLKKWKDIDMIPNIQGGHVFLIKASSADMYQIDKLIKYKVDMVIASMNKHLMHICVKLHARHIDCTLKGSSVSKLLITLFSYYVACNNSIDEGCSILRALSISKDSKVKDSAQCALIFIKAFNIKTFKQGMSKIKELSAKDSGIKLHTVHSAKGLEANSVWVIDSWFEDEQTENMEFVAFSRAKTNLYVAALPELDKK